jgi:Ras GTPase-activating-like protein IQGAP2/3
MMSTTSSSNYTRGRFHARASSRFDMDVNNTTPILPQPSYSNRSRTPSPVRHSPYLGSPTNSPPALSRSGSTYSHPPLSPSSLGDIKKLNRSSVPYLRNLSELEDPVHGLGIPEIETEEVPGTAGRKRLARGESQKVYAGGKLWVDKQRQVIQTYEYLCHVGEAKQYYIPWVFVG